MLRLRDNRNAIDYLSDNVSGKIPLKLTKKERDLFFNIFSKATPESVKSFGAITHNLFMDLLKKKNIIYNEVFTDSNAVDLGIEMFDTLHGWLRLSNGEVCNSSFNKGADYTHHFSGRVGILMFFNIKPFLHETLKKWVKDYKHAVSSSLVVKLSDVFMCKFLQGYYEHYDKVQHNKRVLYGGFFNKTFGQVTSDVFKYLMSFLIFLSGSIYGLSLDSTRLVTLFGSEVPEGFAVFCVSGLMAVLFAFSKDIKIIILGIFGRNKGE